MRPLLTGPFPWTVAVPLRTEALVMEINLKIKSGKNLSCFFRNVLEIPEQPVRYICKLYFGNFVTVRNRK
jgi:hypothetical protein